MAEKRFSLTESQIALLKDASFSAGRAKEQATLIIELAQTKQKALDDLLIMFCESFGIDRNKTEFNLEQKIAIEKEG